MSARLVDPKPLLVGALLLAVTACTSTEPRGPIVEVFGTYNGTEADLFADSMETFERETGIDIHYVGAGAFGPELTARAGAGDLPDIALFPQPGLLLDQQQAGHLVPLDAETANLVEDDYPDGSYSMTSVDGQLFGVPYRISVKSLVWFLPSIFEEREYEIPASWGELTALTARMQNDGFHPWCLAVGSFDSTGWVSTDWIEDLVLRLQGPNVYDDWVSGSITFDDSRIVEAFEVFGGLVNTPGVVLGEPNEILETSWQSAGDPMFDPDPTCLLHRQGSFYESTLPEGNIAGEDIDVFVLPPATDDESAPILVSGELAAAFSSDEAVRQVMAYLASPEAGEAWAQAGGFISPNTRFDVSLYPTEFERGIHEIYEDAEIVRFDGSDLMPPSVGTGSFWEGMNQYVLGTDIETVVQIIMEGYD